MIQKNIQITFLSSDEPFAAKVQTILSKHLTDPDFNTQRFSELLELSRTQLYRKIKKETGLSTSSFIQQQRIKASVELLKNFKTNIKGIGKGVGFNDASYFSKKFKMFMGCSPTEFIESR